METIKEYAARQKVELFEYFKALKSSGAKLPGLAIVQVGHDPASDRYVRFKLSDCKEVGIPCKVINLPETVTERKLLRAIAKLNRDRKVQGFLVQLPLPKQINEEKVKLAVDPKKDIDGFHPLNNKCFAATPTGIIKYLTDQQFDFDGKNAVIIGRSSIVGKPAHQLLLNKNMNVIMLHTHTSEIDKKFYLAHADLIIVATGRPNTLTKDYKLKKSAVVMDVGINVKQDGHLCGDCEKDLAVEFQSPVPGGCGLLTRIAIIENLILLAVAHCWTQQQ